MIQELTEGAVRELSCGVSVWVALEGDHAVLILDGDPDNESDEIRVRWPIRLTFGESMDLANALVFAWARKNP